MLKRTWFSSVRHNVTYLLLSPKKKIVTICQKFHSIPHVGFESLIRAFACRAIHEIK